MAIARSYYLAAASVLALGAMAPASAQNLVVNPGFETGDFTGWTQGGNLGFTGVDGFSANTGAFGAFMGPIGSVGTLTQGFTTFAGQPYRVSFFLRNDAGAINSFAATFDGQNIIAPLADSAAFAYAQQGPVVLFATGAAADLVFTFRHDPSFWRLDDVFVEFLGCAVDNNANTCVITSDTLLFPINALNGTDTLQLGGATNFAFDVARIGAGPNALTSFEVFEKVGTSNATLTGVAGMAADWNIIGGTLTASTGNNIFNTSTVNVGALGTFAVAASETIGRLTGSGATTIANNQTLTTGDATNHSYTGTTGGAGALTKQGTGRFSTLGLGHTGLTTVAAGELNTNGTVAGGVTVNNNATFSGNFNVLGTLTGVGPNSIISVGNSPGTATVGALAGLTVQNVEVQFNNLTLPVNGGTHDFLNVTGNVTGTHTVNIIPFAPSTSPVATPLLGVELFRVGGTVAPTAFALNGPVLQGGFEYLLRHRPDYNGTLDGFFLISTPQQELSLHVAMLSAGRETIKSCARNNPGHPGLGERNGRVWVGGQYGSFDAGAQTGVDYDGDHVCAGGGVDFGVTDWFQLGVSGGYARTEADVNLEMGLAQLEGDTGLIEARAAFTHGQFYIKGSVGYATTDWDVVKTPGRGVASATIDGVIGGLETGYTILFDEPVSLTLTAAALYDGTDCGNNCLIAGALESVSEWTGKLAATLAFNINDPSFQPFITVAISDDFDDGQFSRLGNAVAFSDTGSAVFDAGIGFNAALSDSVTLFAKAGMTRGFDSDYDAYQGSAGLKWEW